MYSLQYQKFLTQTSNLKPTTHKDGFWLMFASPSCRSFKSTEDTGKWLITLSADEVDQAWAKVRVALVEDKLIFAKCSTVLMCNKERPSYVICVYTRDWSDEDDVKHYRQMLKDIGFVQPLKYKRDIETRNRVYGTTDEFYIVE